jgi:hypothetical protein
MVRLPSKEPWDCVTEFQHAPEYAGVALGAIKLVLQVSSSNEVPFPFDYNVKLLMLYPHTARKKFCAFFLRSLQ